MGDKAYENIHVVASILKMYLRLLPIPLITFDVHPLVLQALGELFIISILNVLIIVLALLFFKLNFIS